MRNVTIKIIGGVYTGKSTIAYLIENVLQKHGITCCNNDDYKLKPFQEVHIDSALKSLKEKINVNIDIVQTNKENFNGFTR